MSRRQENAQFRGAGELKNNRDTSIRPAYSARHKQANQTAGIWGRKNAGRAAPCLCCRTPMRLRRFDSEQHCSDGAKHRKSKGSRETCSGETALVRPAMAPSGRDFRKITVSAVCYTRAHAAISLLTGNSQSLLQCRYQAVKFARIH